MKEIINKIKNIKKSYLITGLIVFSFVMINILVMISTGSNPLKSITTSALRTMGFNTEEVKSITITQDGYKTKTPGSFNVNKSADWIGVNKARITFDVDTIIKTSNNYKDIIFVLDISGSMSGDKIEKVKSDTKELVESLLNDSNNKVALITFDTNSTILSDFTNNKEEIINAIENIQTTGTTNYYSGLLNAEEVLKDYKKESNRALNLLFLTDGYPNEQTNNEIAQYKLLKEKYPYMTVNAIQYEMGTAIKDEIKAVSDNQYIANMTTLNNVLFEASINPETYESFEIVDYIDNEYFYVVSKDDIKVPFGTVTLTEENNKQKVIWKIDSGLLRTGSKVKMTIDVKLKSEQEDQEGYFPTNKKAEVKAKLKDSSEIKETTVKTPVLKKWYNVIYDVNAPKECKIKEPSTETKYAYQKVKIKDEALECDGYLFKGWEITTKNVKKINDTTFEMPPSDVEIKAKWSKPSIKKSMKGTVYVKPPSIMKSYTWNSTDDYHNSKYKSKVTKIDFKVDEEIPATAIESWDVSQDQNQSVMAYIEDDGTGNRTYKVTIVGDGDVTANEDSSYLFHNFSALKEIDFSNFDTSNVTTMYSMFYNCRSLTSLDVSNFDTSKVTTMGSMFSGCSNLTSLDVSNFDTSKVITIGFMFSNCSSLTSLDVSNFDTSKVTSMDSMFSKCSSLRSLDVSNFDTSNVKYMCNMFSECSSLTSLDLSNFDTSKITDMHSMFSKCSSLTNLDLSNFDTSNVKYMYDMFSECRSLTSLDVSKFKTSNITSMQQMFQACSSLTSLDVSNFDTSNVTNMQQMFQSCRSLTSIDVSNFDTSKVTNMKNMFSDCYALTSLDVSNFDTSNVTNMQEMFRYCEKITSLDISNFDTSKVKYMESTFYGCHSLTSLDLSNFDTSNVTSMGSMFKGCYNLTTIITIKSNGTTSYSRIFDNSATNSDAQITVNYTSATSSLVDKMIATKSWNSNVVKGTLVNN
ncbi:MAG: BspA family leucine-rich repeat surface protein [Bacilli bacterium]|nr:BspA family leucine-rich repeat surface protein [Bacilli bacterium]